LIRENSFKLHARNIAHGEYGCHLWKRRIKPKKQNTLLKLANKNKLQLALASGLSAGTVVNGKN
jgi:hypothetical protein